MRYVIENKTYQYYVGRFSTLTEVPHIHTHLEMVYMTRGRAAAVADGRKFVMEAGDAFLAMPNQIHYYAPEGETEFYLVIFSASMHPRVEQLLRGRGLSCAVVGRDRLPDGLVGQLARIEQLRQDRDEYRKLEAEGEMLCFLGRVLPCFSFGKEAESGRDSVKSVLLYCIQHYTEHITLESMAAQLHLNKYHISHIFRQRMGMGFSEFINRMRLEHACDLLQKGQGITQTAYDSGFSSIRTFNRVFRDAMAMSPRDYARQWTKSGQA